MGCVLLACLVAASVSLPTASAFVFKAGGTGEWRVPAESAGANANASSAYNAWAQRNRFRVGDALAFTYPPGNDTVLLVDKRAYDACDTAAPMDTFSDGSTVFTFTRSGPYYFISGNKDNCNRGEKLVVVVMAERAAVANATEPGPGLAPSPNGPFSSAYSPPPPPFGIDISPTAANPPPSAAPPKNNTPDNGSSSQSEALLANNGHGGSPEDGASRLNEIDSSILVSNKNCHQESHGDGQDGSQPKKKTLHRLTSRQSEILEGFFSICAHPDELQRRHLSETTGLGLNQVKFWFQNKRTHVKNLSGKQENYRLKAENQMLTQELDRVKQAQSNAPCPRCTNDPGHNLLLTELERLKAHNQILQQELMQIRTGNEIPTAMRSPSGAFHVDSSSENVFAAQYDRHMLTEIAKNAVQELVYLAESNGPLWLAFPGGSFEALNTMAYAQTFPGQISAGTMGLKPEATRANAVVMLDAKSIVGYLMDPDSYGTFFPGLMSSTTTTKLFNWPTAREAGFDGAMQLITTELVFPSPLVPARKCSFMRYCEKLEHGAMAVVDVSLEDGGNCRKLPSGVLIQPIRQNSCKVIAIEHVLVDGTGTHGIFQPCLGGLLFGARRWVMSMARQCARLRDVFHATNYSLNVTSTGRKNVMKLADSLLDNYAASIAAIPADGWIVQCGEGIEGDVRIAYRKNNDSNTAIVSASASLQLPLPMRRAFDILKNHLLRAKWDVLVSGGSVKEEVRVASGVGTEDFVSILHVKHGTGANKNTMMVLQNISYDASGSFMVYSSVDKTLLDMIMSPAGDGASCNVSLFPAGFSIVPLVDPAQCGSALGEAGGIVITVGFQILMKLARGTGLCPRSVSSAIKIMADNISNVKDTLLNTHPAFYSRNQYTN
ncbi:hypothetical protein BS78_03G302200 [Paspalum vaginatum]|nr:hypothetical protein BS78_03G302200 [Paspalum vaginatum]